ncbi:hypothetical protein NPIL_174091 [Nephila pilipes]|uniref:Uncharacterized protein n=1 Tax=Nephila pilipes TaxID=299642 RepID=A0A8X6TE81_NEPPI|nr:hypothetical protein NPIL_174091 [Nephila pilipes]
MTAMRLLLPSRLGIISPRTTDADEAMNLTVRMVCSPPNHQCVRKILRNTDERKERRQLGKPDEEGHFLRVANSVFKRPTNPIVNNYDAFQCYGSAMLNGLEKCLDATDSLIELTFQMIFKTFLTSGFKQFIEILNTVLYNVILNK